MSGPAGAISLEQKLLNDLKEWFQIGNGFSCSCCNKPKKRPELGHFAIWKPRNRMAKDMAKGRAGAYVVCSECEKLPEHEMHMKIEERLAKHGLFGGPVKSQSRS